MMKKNLFIYRLAARLWRHQPEKGYSGRPDSGTGAYSPSPWPMLSLPGCHPTTVSMPPFCPPMVAALFGSSRQLATGPVAVVSLLTATTLEPLATAGSSQYIAYAILLALLIGGFSVLPSVRSNWGWSSISSPYPVVNGFSNAAALIIATSQTAQAIRYPDRQSPAPL